MRFPTLISLMLLAAIFAGCADSGDAPADPNDIPVDKVDATSTTGGIRGVVVDQSIQPVAGATITLTGVEKTYETDEAGAFVIGGLDPGTYFVTATAPLYDAVQQSVEVVAGVEEPPIQKFLLTRLIAEDPYMWTQKYDGYITCSANIIGAKSEECGEGVGVPGQGRVGQQQNNRAQIDFTVDGQHMKTLIIEQVWEPTTEASADGSGQFDTRVALDWSCDPVCGGNTLGRTASGSPLLIRVDAETLESNEFDANTVFSTFTWAEDNPGVLLEQPFELFVTTFYYLEAPPEWSFVAGSPNPYE